MVSFEWRAVYHRGEKFDPTGQDARRDERRGAQGKIAQASLPERKIHSLIQNAAIATRK